MTEVLDPPRTPQEICDEQLMEKLRRHDGIITALVAHDGVVDEIYSARSDAEQLARATLLCASKLPHGRSIHVRWEPYRARAWHFHHVTVVAVYELGAPVAKSLNRAVMRAVRKLYPTKHETHVDPPGHPEPTPG